MTVMQGSRRMTTVMVKRVTKIQMGYLGHELALVSNFMDV